MQVMGEDQWQAVKRWLGSVPPEPVDTLLVLSAVPVVYRSFGLAEQYFDSTPWLEELEDDVHDHWTSRLHEGERMKLIMNLLTNFKDPFKRVIILSGDVHVGGLGIIVKKDPSQVIHQITSSAIVHPPPSYLEWLGITALTSDEKEAIGADEITIENIRPFHSEKFIRVRNFAALWEGTDKKLWVNWICDDGLEPAYAIGS